MQSFRRYFGSLVFVVLLFSIAALPTMAEGEGDFIGLWKAKKVFVPNFKGKLTVTSSEGAWLADIAGREAKGEVKDNQIFFHFPENDNIFPGGLEFFKVRLDGAGNIISGFWYSPFTFRVGMKNAIPLLFENVRENVWQSQVVPMEDGFTLYLVIAQDEDGMTRVFLRNPDRNLGVFTNLKRLEREGNKLKFIGTFRRGEQEQIIYEANYNPEWDKFTIDIPNRGGAFDFYRVGENSSDFYARAKNPPEYTYSPPPLRDDGWEVGTLEEAGISFGPIREMVLNEIDPVPTSVDDLYVHGLLISRHGKLVFEDYFHGYHRDLPHDTRSASKSLTSVLTGAAIEAGYPVSVSMPVYEAIYGENLPKDLDPRKYKITLRNLLTMSSGFYCDDRDPNAPGNEDVMQEQEEENDWYHYTLTLPIALEPGEEAIYCSVNPNLIGNVLIAASGKPLEDLFRELIAEPLQMGRYHLHLQPTGEPYMGGGIYWLPRDFIKLGQLMLNGGTWNGERVVSEEWVKESSAPYYDIRDRQYSYLWWVQDYPYKDGTVRGFMAGGNGGQVVLVIPELDLVVNFWGGNYSSKTLYRMSGDLITDYILKAVAEEERSS